MPLIAKPLERALLRRLLKPASVFICLSILIGVSALSLTASTANAQQAQKPGDQEELVMFFTRTLGRNG
jgi:hypothetical protein